MSTRAMRHPSLPLLAGATSGVSVGGGVSPGLPTMPLTAPVGRAALSVGWSPALSVGWSPALSVGWSPALSVGWSPALSVGWSPALSVGWSPALSVGWSPALSVGQSIRLDFFVWTAALSTLDPNVSELSGHGLAV